MITDSNGMCILRDVSLDEFMWPCLTYAMRRSGMIHCILRERFMELPRYEVPDDMDKIPVGAVLYWQCGEGSKEWNLTVEGQTIVSTYTYNRGHYAVYEGNGLVSDLSWLDSGEPYIRFRKLPDCQCRPDKMICEGWHAVSPV